MREQKSFKTIIPDEDKRLLINGSLHDKIIVALNSRPQIQEIEVPDYIGNASTLEEIKQTMILKSKANLAQYLEDNPLFSKSKYSDGRYYKVTAEKQQQLTSKILMYEGYQKLGIPYDLTWNDCGEVCETWSFEELFQLSMEIDAYVTPLVKIQQTMEVNIKNSESVVDALKVNIDYTTENIMKYLNIIEATGEVVNEDETE